MTTFDLKEIDVLEFLTELEIRNISEETETEIRFSCPFPGHLTGDTNPSAYMNRESTAWFCHGCKRKGNALTFVSDLHNLSNPTALRFLRQRWGGEFKPPETTLEGEILEYFLQQGKPTAEPINYTLQDKVLSDFGINPMALGYMLKRGFTSDPLLKFEIGFDELSRRITIPIFDEVGQLVGFKGRAIDPDNLPKYKVLGGSKYGFPRYHTGMVVFGINYVPEAHKDAILVEGELNVVAMHQLGFFNAIALGGSTFTETHARKIIERFETITLLLDSDQAGVAGTLKAAEALEQFMTVKVAPEHDYDPADLLKQVKKNRSH